ncbi:glycosyltransferase [Candidatus Parcubacteria bacterium]|nr:glycosyltransferase [Patescibacteria group bacterium]MCG2689400.1 glycosyltransferase [Candidatus Parcubacteria bacterium]
MSTPLVSIIIIAEKWNEFLEESLPKYQDLRYLNCEILVITTEEIQKRGETHFWVRPKKGSHPICLYHDKNLKNRPAEKRDLAIKYAKGEIFAFIDDDAFPSPNWLAEAVKNFNDPSVVAVGGPGLTPETASTLEKASGWVSASPLGGFGSNYRFFPSKKRFVDDYPSFNLLVRKENFIKVGGFDSGYFPGEDTKLCLELTRDGVSKIVYDPKALVYHHRRPLFKKHLIQNGRFGLHRGHFARILPATSRRWFYFIPSLFSIGLIGGILLLPFGFQLVKLGLLGGLGIYGILLIANAIWVFGKCRNLTISLLTIPGVFLTHFWYGAQFLRGFFKRKMKDNYGRA